MKFWVGEAKTLKRFSPPAKVKLRSLSCVRELAVDMKMVEGETKAVG